VLYSLNSRSLCQAWSRVINFVDNPHFLDFNLTTRLEFEIMIMLIGFGWNSQILWHWNTQTIPDFNFSFQILAPSINFIQIEFQFPFHWSIIFLLNILNRRWSQIVISLKCIQEECDNNKNSLRRHKLWIFHPKWWQFGISRLFRHSARISADWDALLTMQHLLWSIVW
jgi:hypothetical protein